MPISQLDEKKRCYKFKLPNLVQSLMGTVRNIFAVDVERHIRFCEQRIAFIAAKSIWDEAAQRLLVA